MEITNKDVSMPRSPLALQAMPQQHHIHSQDDDWTGVTSTSERRKLQNRLNQRAYRQRKNKSARRQKTVAVYRELLEEARPTETNTGECKTDETEPTEEVSREAVPVALSEGYKMLIVPQWRDNVLRFAREAYEQYTLKTPWPNQLNLLIKLNVLNALARNATLIGLPNERVCADDAVSPFSQPGALPLPDQKAWPVALKPTPVQYEMHHHPWIDLVPFPLMRERAIRAVHAGLLDEDELVLDLAEVCHRDAVHTPFLIVWGDSADPGGWEATLPFLEKYGWLVWGCTELFASTNKWRSRRGEKVLGL